MNNKIMIYIALLLPCANILPMQNQMEEMKNQIALSGATSQYLGYAMVAYNKKVIFPVCGLKEPNTLFVKSNTGVEQYSRDLHGEVGTIDNFKDCIGKSKAGTFIIRAFERSKQNVTCPNSFMITLYSLAAQTGQLQEVNGTTQLISREEILRSN